MNPTIHSKISVKRFGGKIEDYHKIHSFMDSSKEVEPTNLHRCLTHHLWFTKNVVIPVFGGHFKNSDNKDVDVKDLCELDHILPDFQNKFVPSLSDYFELLEPNDEDKEKLFAFGVAYSRWLYKNYGEELTQEIMTLVIQPFSNTGLLTSWYLTHNSWFVNNIIPKVFKQIDRFNLWDGFDENGQNVMIKPSDFLNRMKYDSWIQNGQSYPKSHEKVKKYREESFKRDLNSVINHIENNKDSAFKLLDSKFTGNPHSYLDGSSSEEATKVVSEMNERFKNKSQEEITEEIKKLLKDFPKDTNGEFNLDDPKPEKELDYKFLDAYYDGSKLGPRATDTRLD